MHTAKVGAEVFGMELSDFAAQTEANFERLFSKVMRQQVAA
jgi:TatD DNase family protein